MRDSFLLLMAHSLIGTGFFFLYVHHLRSIYESRTSIAHMTQLEREAMLRQEDALYFSFYKTLVSEPNFMNGIEKLKNVTDIEHPHHVNVLQRFYVLPEVTIAFLYRYSGYQRFSMLTCWRSGDMSMTGERCDGFAQAMQFYLEFVWLLGGLTLVVIYLYSTLLSENVFGGIYAVVSYIMFHSYASKIYERPMARENFAFPFILLQMFYLSVCIQKVFKQKEYQFSTFAMLKLTLLTGISLLCWQFSSIIFATQIIIMMTPWSFSSIDNSVSCSFTFFYALSQLFGNVLAYYYSSYSSKFIYSWQIGPAISLLIISLTRARQEDVSFSLKSIGMGILLAFSGQGTTINILEKAGISRSIDNTYAIYRDLILNWLLQAKVNFSTSLAACNPDLKRMDWLDLWELVKTLIVKPYCLYGVVMLAKFFRKWRKKNEQKTPSNDHVERAKNYVLEDFLEENHISMNDMTNKATENDLNECFKLLEECDFDYERYKIKKSEINNKQSDEHIEFMNDIKKLREQIHELQDKEQKTKQLTAQPITVDKQTSTTSDTKPKPSKNVKTQTNLTGSCSTKRVKSNKNTAKRSSTSNRSPNRVDMREVDGNTTTGAAIIQNDFLSFHYVYSFVQMIVFTLIGLSIKKLFFLCFTQGCVITPTICSKFWYRKQRNIFWTVSLAVFLTSLLDPGLVNVREEYFPKRVTNSNDDVETMLEWIKLNTERTAVFAGPVDIIGTVYLTTKRPIVNHAHLEMRQISDRTEHVYSIFSRQQSSDIYNQCSQLKIQYVIITLKDCTNEIR
ncbi:C-mannosyltransferase dpy-19 homolog [Teleopsis dalmanni]|nr:C-mannosyltransferase dpy-19 homolog [Teleopsis dalmanni]